jgi:hypothetical protein
MSATRSAWESRSALPMNAITSIATIPIGPALIDRWLSGNLALEWSTRFSDLFDADDLRIAKSQPTIHFYEWLGAIALHRDTGYLSLVEKYEFAKHPRRRDIVSRLRPPPPGCAPRPGPRSWQAPDLLMYAPDLSDWFFCEVKRPVTAYAMSRSGSSVSLRT